MHAVKDPTQFFSEQNKTRPYRRSAYLPFSLLFSFILTTRLLNADALVTIENINAMRFPSFPLQIALKGDGYNYFRRRTLECGKQQHSNARLFSTMPKYLDHLSLSNALSNTAPAIPEHSSSYSTYLPHHDGVTTLAQQTQMAEILTKESQSRLHHSTLSQAQSITDSLENVFSYDLPEGKCVGLRLVPQTYSVNKSASLDPKEIQSNENHWIKQTLHADEVQYGIDLPTEQARMTFYVGRLAIRTALSLACQEKKESNAGKLSGCVSNDQQSKLLRCVSSLGSVSSSGLSILKDHYGRPQVPTGFIGSISHKGNLGVALVSSSSDGSLPPTRGIGVDIEQTFTRRKDIAKRVLTEREIKNLGNMKGVTRDEEVLLRFSLKECVYKAMHPLICQWVGFQEAEITPKDDGTSTIELNLKSGAQERFQHVEAHWQRIEGEFFLTSSSVILKKQ